MTENAAERLPESSIIFQDTTIDGRHTLTIWRDHGRLTALMRENGIAAMGMLTVYNNHRNVEVHTERIALSYTAVYGSGPTKHELDYWKQVADRFSD